MFGHFYVNIFYIQCCILVTHTTINDIFGEISFSQYRNFQTIFQITSLMSCVQLNEVSMKCVGRKLCHAINNIRFLNSIPSTGGLRCLDTKNEEGGPK